MRKTRKVSIRTETRELLIITRNGSPETPSWCDRCAGEVAWLTFGDAAKANEMSVGELSILMETGRVHFCEMSDGNLLFCQNSFAAPTHDEQLLPKGDENGKTDY
jgi:hypothetical protein